MSGHSQSGRGGSLSPSFLQTGSSSFAEFLATHDPTLLPSGRPLPPGAKVDAVHGTTIVALAYAGGVVMAGDYWYLEHFWHKFANSVFVAVATMLLTLLIGSLAAFALGRMRLARGWLFANFPVVTYAVPASFLVIPFYRIMREYGLSDSLWAVVAADVTFATPYAILILQQYAKLIPLELDEAAQVDGASPFVVYRRIYLPLMAPALVAMASSATTAKHVRKAFFIEISSVIVECKKHA